LEWWNFKKILEQLSYAVCGVRTSIYQTYFVFVPLFTKKTLKIKAKYSIYEKLSRVFRVAGSRFEEK